MYESISEDWVRRMADVARYHVQEERWDQGVRALNEVIRARPEVWEYRVLRAEALRRLERPADALVDARQAAQLRPDDVDVKLLLGELCLLNYEFKEAVGLLTAVFEADYDAECSPQRQPERVKRAGFSLAVIQRMGSFDSVQSAGGFV